MPIEGLANHLPGVYAHVEGLLTITYLVIMPIDGLANNLPGVNIHVDGLPMTHLV